MAVARRFNGGEEEIKKTFLAPQARAEQSGAR
jgi:hypothetical protein